MSKERARRRAQRESAAAAERARVAAARRRRAGIRRVLRVSAAPLRRAAALVDGSAGNSSALGRARNRQNGTLLAALLACHVVLWLLSGSWWLRGSALVLTALAWPLLTVLCFDRRSTR